MLKRFPDGATGEMFFQKRVPAKRPDWLQTATVAFPSGRTAEELCPADLAHLIWAANLGCLDLNPWAVRRWDLDHPDELRVDLDPQPGVTFDDVRAVAGVVRDVLTEHGIDELPEDLRIARASTSTSASWPSWDFAEVRRAALAMAREVERRMPDRATTKWWKEERGERVFLDYNQNARDRTVAVGVLRAGQPRGHGVGSVHAGTSSTAVELADFTIATVPARCAPTSATSRPAIDDEAFSLEVAPRSGCPPTSRTGLGDAPWPPNFPKMAGEPDRVQPSRRAHTPEAADG